MLPLSISPKPIASNLQTFCKSTNAKIKDILVNGQNLTWYNIYANILNVNTILEDGIAFYFDIVFGFFPFQINVLVGYVVGF